MKRCVCPKQQICQNSHLLKLVYCTSAKDGFQGFFTPATLLLAVLYLILVKGPVLIRCFHQVCLITLLLIQSGEVSHEGSSSEKMEEHGVRKDVRLWISCGCGKDSSTSLPVPLMSHKRTRAASKAEMLLRVGRGIIP